MVLAGLDLERHAPAWILSRCTISRPAGPRSELPCATVTSSTASCPRLMSFTGAGRSAAAGYELHELARYHPQDEHKARVDEGGYYRG